MSLYCIVSGLGLEVVEALARPLVRLINIYCSVYNTHNTQHCIILYRAWASKSSKPSRGPLYGAADGRNASGSACSVLKLFCGRERERERE